MRKFCCLFTNYVRCKIFRSTNIDEIVVTEDYPDVIKPKTIYLRGKNNHFWSLALHCPCCCGDVIYVNLVKDEHPYWMINWNSNGTISLEPSIWRTKNCKSHFFYINGKIKWC